ncbi:ubiquitin-conjugating enzyme/RWD-like protein [Gorgonomyces haynaldii]|nr:ubiquitin-conjugating enzyme/RWD-like protein [Gorgonomyces haynaldii]
MTSSRATLLLERERYWLERQAPWGIEGEFYGNDPYEWRVKIKGLQDTCYEGMELTLGLSFHLEYNDTPPEACFLTVPFHPNIDIVTGRVCAGFLQEGWHPDMRIGHLLIQIQQLLVEPVLEDPVNEDAAQMYTQSIHLYEQLVRDTVVATKRLESGGPLFDTEIQAPPEEIPELPPVRSKPSISFDKYHEDWKTAATTLPYSTLSRLEMRKMTLLERFTRENRLKDKQVKSLIARQRELWYGTIPIETKKPVIYVRAPDIVIDEPVQEARERKVSLNDKKERKISFQDRKPSLTQKIPDPKPISIPMPKLPKEDMDVRPFTTDSNEEWEKDAEALVNWSTQLEDVV